MRKRLLVVLLAAVIVSGSQTFAQALPGTGPIEPGVPTDAVQSASSASTTLRMGGTIDKYDASTRVLSLSTLTGTVQLPLASTARIGWGPIGRGPQKIEASELQKLTGFRAVIRYSESNGKKTVESIRVFDKNGRVER
jgi:hypothetical protein